MTPNKYHPSGRLYGARELAASAYDLLSKMLVPGYHGTLGELRNLKPFNEGRNAAKRNACSLGYKSLKQFNRALHRA